MGFKLKKSKSKIHLQKGYLLVVAVIIIVLVGFIGTLLAYMFAGKARSLADTNDANRALYLANSGMEIAKRAISNGTSTCTYSGIGTDTSLATNYTNSTLISGGTFSITCSEQYTTTTLNGAINASTTTINVANSSNLNLKGGFAMIDNEIIKYRRAAGNQLLDVTRGAFGSTATTHNNVTTVYQIQSLINSSGTTTTGSKRTVQEIIYGQTIPTFGSGKTSTIASCGQINWTGSGQMSNINANSYNIVTGAGVNMTGSMSTYIGTPPVRTSWSGHFGNDIYRGYEPLPGKTCQESFFYLSFKQSLIDMENASTNYQGVNYVGSGNVTLSPGSLSQVSYTGSGNLNITSQSPIIEIGRVTYTGSGTINIGSTTNPLIVIVNGNFTITGSASINIGNIGNSNMPTIVIVKGSYNDTGSGSKNYLGLLYVQGNANITGSSSSQGKGMMVVNGTTNLTGSGSFNFDPSILNVFGNTYTNISYNPNFTIKSEVFN